MTFLPTYLWAAADKAGRAPAIQCLSGPDIAFDAFEAKATSLARALTSQLGVAPGDRLAIAMSNHVEYAIVLFGAWMAGLCVAPMNPRLHPREFAGLMQDCDAKLCVTTPDLTLAVGSELAGSRRMIDCTSSEYLSLTNAPAERQPLDLAPGSPAWLFYTSGTTGHPKGAILTHRNLDAMTQSFLLDSGAAQSESLLHIAPMSHAGGLIGLAYVNQALPQFVPPADAIAPKVFSRCIQAAGSVSLFAVPTVLKRLMDPEILPPSLHHHICKILFGGAPMYAEDLRQAISHFGAERLWGGYGQGEAPCTIAHLPSAALADKDHPDYQKRLGSVGFARTGVEIRIADENDRDSPIGTIGEVLVRGPVVMAGYWNRPEATAETLRNGWLHTGDLGRMDDDGLLTLVDRSKDMIISGGTNIYPREIEEVLLTHPDVVEAAVVGAPDAKWGEVAVAYVVGNVTADQLDALCLDHIARFKRPKRYVFVRELPKSSYGKVLKSALKPDTPTSHGKTKGHQ